MAKQYKYLGKKVKDVGSKGLDRVKEYRSILNAIVREAKKGVIKKNTARGRLLLLYRLVDKNEKFKASPKTKQKLKEEIREAMRKL